MNTRKKYPKEFKLDAVSLVLDQSYTRIEFIMLRRQVEQLAKRPGRNQN